MGFRSAGLAPGPDSDGLLAAGWPGDLRSACSAILFRTSESEGRSAGELRESGVGILASVGPWDASGPTPVLDRGEAEDGARSWSLLRMSESEGGPLDRPDSSGVGAAVLDGVWLASGFARSLDAGVARTWPSSLLRTSESEARPADGPASNRFADPRLADGVLASDRMLDWSNVGSVALVRFTLGRVGVDRVTLGPLAADGLELGASSVRWLASGELKLRPETRGAAAERHVRLGAW